MRRPICDISPRITCRKNFALFFGRLIMRHKYDIWLSITWLTNARIHNFPSLVSVWCSVVLDRCLENVLPTNRGVLCHDQLHDLVTISKTTIYGLNITLPWSIQCLSMRLAQHASLLVYWAFGRWCIPIITSLDGSYQKTPKWLCWTIPGKLMCEVWI
jgi:hypothetical protein